MCMEQGFMTQTSATLSRKYKMNIKTAQNTTHNNTKTAFGHIHGARFHDRQSLQNHAGVTE